MAYDAYHDRAAERRERATVRIVEPGAPADPEPTNGAAAVALAGFVSAIAWALAGGDTPRYTRAEIPVRIVDRAS
jgi:hypothetical protein